MPVKQSVSFQLLINSRRRTLEHSTTLIMKRTRHLTVNSLHLLSDRTRKRTSISIRLLTNEMLRIRRNSLPSNITTIRFAYLLCHLIRVFLVIRVSNNLGRGTFNRNILLQTPIISRLMMIDTTRERLLLRFIIAPASNDCRIYRPKVDSNLIMGQR